MPRFVLTYDVRFSSESEREGGRTVSVHGHVKIADLTVHAEDLAEVIWCYILGEFLDHNLGLLVEFFMRGL